tara:strand:- start:329 stop:502 length:174 start_codon:yes stop_codon:yes gene_type:complete
MNMTKKLSDKEKLKVLADFLRNDVRTCNYFELSAMKKADWYDYNFQKAGKILDELDL